MSKFRDCILLRTRLRSLRGPGLLKAGEAVSERLWNWKLHKKLLKNYLFCFCFFKIEILYYLTNYWKHVYRKQWNSSILEFWMIKITVNRNTTLLINIQQLNTFAVFSYNIQNIIWKVCPEMVAQLTKSVFLLCSIWVTWLSSFIWNRLFCCGMNYWTTNSSSFLTCLFPTHSDSVIGCNPCTNEGLRIN